MQQKVHVTTPSPHDASSAAPSDAEALGASEVDAGVPGGVEARGFARLAAALASRNFRLLWLGAATSTSGTWMQRVAQNWLVLTLTGSAFYLGLDSFLGEVPILLFTLIGGVIADRHDRRTLLMTSQWIQLACAFILAGLVFTERVEVWHVLTLSFITGLAQAFGGPAYQSLIPALVPRDHLPNAIALNSIQFNLARVFGPLMAGATLAALGMAACFMLNGISFLFVLAALALLRLPPHEVKRQQPHILDDLRRGIAYVRRRQALVSLIAVAFLSTFLGFPMQTLLPVFAQEVFHQGVGEYSRMMTCAGAGAVAGALVVAWLGRFAHMGRTLLILLGVYGVLVVAFALSRELWVTYVLLFASGSAVIITSSLLTSLAQLVAPDHLRGRVMSIFMVAFRGGMPLGNLLSGTVASLTSAPLILAINGLVIVVVSAYFLTRRQGVAEL
ncbi:MAG: MFS transporter [Luteitalea sp.]|nr:MFS transporter [Luteitalea sp.]